MSRISNPDAGNSLAVWSFVQDWKFYSAEGGRKRGHWADNSAFKNGAIQGYQAAQPHSFTIRDIENSIRPAREIIEIEDESGSDQVTDSDFDSSDEDDATRPEVEDWIRNTISSQAPLQYFDVDTRRWMTQDEDVSDGFLAELKDIASALDSDGRKLEGKTLVENVTNISPSESQGRDAAGGDLGFGGPEMGVDQPIEDSVASLPPRDHPKDIENLADLCADLMDMHGDKATRSVQAGHLRDIDYELAWTGM